MIKDFVELEGVLVNKNIFTTKFSCDVTKCKGACCTLKSDYGAPIYNDEIQQIQKFLPIIMENLSERNKESIERNGFWEESNGELLIKSIDKRDCVFVYWENDIAKCSIEKAYFEDKIEFRKPISCHLFPIRVSDFGGKVLKYEEYTECKDALTNGEKQNLNVLNFCKDALESAFSKSWFLKLKNSIR